MIAPVLLLLACICAENIPLTLALIVAAGISIHFAQYRTCPHCGAHLDPGEACDCQETEKGRPSATNTETATADKVTTISASILTD